MIDDTVNQIARRVAIHQAVDEVVDARRNVFGASTTQDAAAYVRFAMSDDCPDENVWRYVAAVAQGQLEQAMEERAA